MSSLNRHPFSKGRPPISTPFLVTHRLARQPRSFRILTTGIREPWTQQVKIVVGRGEAVVSIGLGGAVARSDGAHQVLAFTDERRGKG